MITLNRAPRCRQNYIQRSITPCQRAPKQHLLSEFPEKMERFVSTRAFRTENVRYEYVYRCTPIIHISLVIYFIYINAFLQNFLSCFHNIISSTAVFNIDNNNKCFLSTKSASLNDFVIMWPLKTGEVTAITGINYILKYSLLKCKKYI